MKLQFVHKVRPFSNLAGMLDRAELANADKFSSRGYHSDNNPGSTVIPSGIFFAGFRGKMLLVLFFLMFSMAGFSQTSFSLAVSGGGEHSFNFLQNNTNGSDVYPDFNLGVDGIINIGEKMRLRAELRYANLNYTHDWNSHSTAENHILTSVRTISNLNLTPRFDYKLASGGKFDLYASAGFKFEFTLGDLERTKWTGGDKTTTHYLDNSEYTKTQAGAVGGLILKYNVNPSFGFILAPDYTCFFDKFSSKNDWVMQRVGVNLGVEWKF